MEIEAPDIFTVLSPMMILARLAGYAPYKLKMAQANLRQVEYTLVYDLLTYVTHVTGTILIVYLMIQTPVDSTSRMVLTYRMMIRFGWFVYMVSVTVFNKVYVHETILVLNSLHEIETVLLKLGCRIFYRSLKRDISAVIILEITSMVLQVILLCLQIPDEFSDKLSAIAFTVYYFNVTHVVLFCNFFAVYYVLSHFLCILNEFYLTNYADVEAKTLANIYQTLWRIAADANKTMSVQLLLIFCVYFWGAIQFGENILTFYVQGLMNYEQVCMFLYYNFKSAMIIYISRKCMKNATRTKSVLAILLCQERRPSVKRKLNALALQLLHEEIRITAGGFFVIDNPIIMAIIGGVTIYMVILVQFQ